MRRAKAFVGVLVIFLLGMGDACGEDEDPPKPPDFNGYLQRYSCCEAGRQSQVLLTVRSDVDYAVMTNDALVSGAERLDSDEWILELPHCGGRSAAVELSTFLVRLEELEGVDGFAPRTVEIALEDLREIPRCDCGNGTVERGEQCEQAEDCGIAACGSDCRCEFEPWSQSFREFCNQGSERCFEDETDDFVTLSRTTENDAIAPAMIPDADIVRVAVLGPEDWPVVNLQRQVQLALPDSDLGGLSFQVNDIEDVSRRTVMPDPRSVVLFVEMPAPFDPGSLPDTPGEPIHQLCVEFAIGNERDFSLEQMPYGDTILGTYCRGRYSYGEREGAGATGVSPVFTFERDNVIAFMLGTSHQPPKITPDFFGVIAWHEISGIEQTTWIAADVLGRRLDRLEYSIPPGIEF